MQYTKPPLSVSDQIQLLEDRGLIIPDRAKASHYLSFISYYRLRAYTYPFQNNNDPNHPFQNGCTFDEVLELYIFDRELRLLVLDAIERIEIALRTQIIHHFAMHHGSHWHENPALFANRNLFNKDRKKLRIELGRSSEVFIEHYYNKYTQPADPPCWMSLEVVSLGFLSKNYENLKLSNAKKVVARNLGLPHPTILESWMHSFSYVRNICAHHGRLWNRQLTKTPKFPKRAPHTWLSKPPSINNKLFLTLSCLIYLLDRISPGHQWRKRFKDLLQKHSSIETIKMGFPSDWEQEALWS